jgi:hypothetical protein
MTTMSKLFTRAVLIPVWLIVFGLFVLFTWLGSPMTLGMLVLLLIVGAMPPAIMLLVWKTPQRSVAQVLQDVEASRAER